MSSLKEQALETGLAAPASKGAAAQSVTRAELPPFPNWSVEWVATQGVSYPLSDASFTISDTVIVTNATPATVYPNRVQATPRGGVIGDRVAWALTSEEWSEVRNLGYLTLQSVLPGRTYLIPHTSGSMVLVTENGELVKKLCLQPAGTYLTNTLWLILQMLMIRADERAYTKKAVHWSVSGVRRDLSYESDERPRFAELYRTQRNARRRAQRANHVT